MLLIDQFHIKNLAFKVTSEKASHVAIPFFLQILVKFLQDMLG